MSIEAKAHMNQTWLYHLPGAGRQTCPQTTMTQQIGESKRLRELRGVGEGSLEEGDSS